MHLVLWINAGSLPFSLPLSSYFSLTLSRSQAGCITLWSSLESGAAGTAMPSSVCRNLWRQTQTPDSPGTSLAGRWRSGSQKVFPFFSPCTSSSRYLTMLVKSLWWIDSFTGEFHYLQLCEIIQWRVISAEKWWLNTLWMDLDVVVHRLHNWSMELLTSVHLCMTSNS